MRVPFKFLVPISILFVLARPSEDFDFVFNFVALAPASKKQTTLVFRQF